MQTTLTVVYQSFILDIVHIIQDDMEYYEIYFKENVDEEETAALITCLMIFISQVMTTSYAGVYDGYIRDRASLNADNVSEKNYKIFSHDLSEDTEVIETKKGLADEAAKT